MGKKKKRKPQSTKAVENQAFAKVFENIQLSAFYVLYYDFDWSKQKVKNFNGFMLENNKGELSREWDFETEYNRLKGLGIDTRQMVQDMPTRTKLNLIGGSKRMATAYDEAQMAMSLYFVLAFYTLRQHYKFTKGDMQKFYEKFVELTDNFRLGMKSDHLYEYFKMECNLDICIG